MAGNLSVVGAAGDRPQVVEMWRHPCAWQHGWFVEPLHNELLYAARLFANEALGFSPKSYAVVEIAGQLAVTLDGSEDPQLQEFGCNLEFAFMRSATGGQWLFASCACQEAYDHAGEWAGIVSREDMCKVVVWYRNHLRVCQLWEADEPEAGEELAEVYEPGCHVLSMRHHMDPPPSAS